MFELYQNYVMKHIKIVIIVLLVFNYVNTNVCLLVVYRFKCSFFFIRFYIKIFVLCLYNILFHLYLYLFFIFIFFIFLLHLTGRHTCYLYTPRNIYVLMIIIIDIFVILYFFTLSLPIYCIKIKQK